MTILMTDTYDGGEAGDADDDVMIAAVVVTKMKTSTTMMIGTVTVVTNVACLHLPAIARLASYEIAHVDGDG